MKNNATWLVYTLLLLLMAPMMVWAAPAAKADPVPEKLPWTLREHYTFHGEGLRLDYAKDNAEWRIKEYEEDSESSRMYPKLVLRDVGFSIDVKNGPVLNNELLSATGETTMHREAYNCDILGEGTTYAVEFVPYEGLTVKHSLITMRRWNFIRVVISITNTSGAPVEIAKISPVIISSDNYPNLSVNAVTSTNSLVYEDGKAVLGDTGAVNTIRLFDPDRNVTLLMGFIPTGQGVCEFRKYPAGAPLEGIFETVYDPAVVIADGETMESNPLSIGFGIDAEIMEGQYAYLLRKFCEVPETK